MPGPTPLEVTGDDHLPPRVDVVVVGGGAAGVSAALELVERGVSVALCEKGWIAHEQSSRNWGWVRMSRRDPREVPLMAESIRLWRRMHQRIGRDVGYRQAGIVFACESEEQRELYDAWRRNVAEHAPDMEMIGAERLRGFFPGLALPTHGGLYSPGDGRAEPQIAVPAMAQAVRAKGGAILTQCAARGFETAAGRVSGVVTERGLNACDAVVVAGGAWTNLFLRRQGIDLPQLNVMNSVVRTEPISDGPEVAIWSRSIAMRKREDGGYTIASGTMNVVDIVPRSFRYARKYLPALREERRAIRFRLGARFLDELRERPTWALDAPTPFERVRVLDPNPSARYTRDLLPEAAKIWPAFRSARIAQAWAGYMDVTPDAVPVIAPIAEQPGLFVSTGYSGHGFGIGPGAGALVADLVTGAPPRVDPRHFRLERFFDGSPIELMPNMRS